MVFSIIHKNLENGNKLLELVRFDKLKYRQLHNISVADQVVTKKMDTNSDDAGTSDYRFTKVSQTDVDVTEIEIGDHDDDADEKLFTIPSSDKEKARLIQIVANLRKSIQLPPISFDTSSYVLYIALFRL